MVSPKKLKISPEFDKETTATANKSKSLKEKSKNIIHFIQAFLIWIENNYIKLILIFLFFVLVLIRGIITSTDWTVIGDFFQNHMSYLPEWTKVGIVFWISSILSIAVLPYLFLRCFEDIFKKDHEAKEVFSKKISNTFLLSLPFMITGLLVGTKMLFIAFQNDQHLWAIPVIFILEVGFQIILGISIVLQVESIERFFKKSIFPIFLSKNRNQ
jgi:hypothetical protein